jgi:hypothetical protein
VTDRAEGVSNFNFDTLSKDFDGRERGQQYNVRVGATAAVTPLKLTCEHERK